MIRDEESLMCPPLDELLQRISQKYELVLAATRRAKQIIREQRLNPLAVDEQTARRKPLSIALADIAEGKVDQQSLMAPDIELDEPAVSEMGLFAEGEEVPEEAPDDFSGPDEGGEDASEDAGEDEADLGDVELDLDWNIEHPEENEDEPGELDLDWSPDQPKEP
jgi:DNA-directed RNA polymerase omega subunit